MVSDEPGADVLEDRWPPYVAGKGDGSQVERLTPVSQSAPRPRTAQRVALIAWSLVGVSSFVGPDAVGRYGLLVVGVVAAFVGWLASRAGASPRQIISSVLLVVVAVLLSRVITFVVLYLWAFA